MVAKNSTAVMANADMLIICFTRSPLTEFSRNASMGRTLFFVKPNSREFPQNFQAKVLRPLSTIPACWNHGQIDQDQTDQKILAVPNRNPRYDEIHTMDQIFIHVRREIEHFFTIYKELEGRTTTTLGWKGPAEARRVIVEARKKYLAKRPLANTEQSA